MRDTRTSDPRQAPGRPARRPRSADRPAQERPRDLDLAATQAGPLPADTAPGHEPLPKDAEEFVGGPGLVATRRMWRDVWTWGAVGTVLGAIVGLVVGLVWAAASSVDVTRAVLIGIVAFGAGGGTLAFMLGGMKGAADDADPEWRASDTDRL